MSRHEYSPELQSALTHLGWQGRLNEAMTADDVVAVVRDYMAQWSPGEISQLPQQLRPGKIVDSDDVGSYAFALVREQMGRDTSFEAQVHKMGAFFSTASLRLAQIMARASEVSSEEGRS